MDPLLNSFASLNFVGHYPTAQGSPTSLLYTTIELLPGSLATLSALTQTIACQAITRMRIIVASEMSHLLDPIFIGEILAKLPALEELVLEEPQKSTMLAESSISISAESWGKALKQGVGLRCFTLPASFVDDDEEDDFPMDEEFPSQDDDEPIEAEPTQCHDPSISSSSTEEAVHTPSGYCDYPAELRHMSTVLRTFAELVMEEISRDDFQEVRFLYCERGASNRRRMLKYVLMIDTEAEAGEPRYIPYWARCTTDEEAYLESWSRSSPYSTTF